MFDAVQIAKATEARLKSERRGERGVRRNHRVATRQSRATMTVGTAEPKRRTAANTKVSETDSRADNLGILTVNEPVSRVRAARMSHSCPGGAWYMWIIDASITVIPAVMTAPTYHWPARDSGIVSGIDVN
jgi:hypothetical protein